MFYPLSSAVFTLVPHPSLPWPTLALLGGGNRPCWERDGECDLHSSQRWSLVERIIRMLAMAGIGKAEHDKRASQTAGVCQTAQSVHVLTSALHLAVEADGT